MRGLQSSNTRGNLMSTVDEVLDGYLGPRIDILTSLEHYLSRWNRPHRFQVGLGLHRATVNTTRVSLAMVTGFTMAILPNMESHLHLENPSGGV